MATKINELVENTAIKQDSGQKKIKVANRDYAKKNTFFLRYLTKLLSF